MVSRVHTHTWGDHPPEGPLSWDKTWDEQYFDTEALSENTEVKSEDYTLDILYTLELDPNSRFDEQFWPEVVEWCSGCKEHRMVSFVNRKVLEKVQALEGKEDEVLCKVALGDEIDSDLHDQVVKKVKKDVVKEKKVVAEVKVEGQMGNEVLVEETLGEKAMARSNLYLRPASTPKVPLPPISTTPIFWRPWEASCEPTARRKWSGEATTTTTLLSSVGVTPPALVTPPREEVKSTGRKVGRRLRRLLTFQATLEKEKGLPPSRWQRRLHFGEEGEATFLNTTGTPVSRRRKWWRREGMGRWRPAALG